MNVHGVDIGPDELSALRRIAEGKPAFDCFAEKLPTKARWCERTKQLIMPPPRGMVHPRRVILQKLYSAGLIRRERSFEGKTYVVAPRATGEGLAVLGALTPNQ